jgi:biopolymer transport protein ExbB
MTDLWHHTLTYWTSGGLLLLPLAGVCMGIWVLFLRSREFMVSVSRECRELECHVTGHGLHDTGAGPIGTLLQRVQADVLSGAGPRTAFHARGEECLKQLGRDILLLAALTAVAPLMGLLGTVRGMMATFSAVSEVAGNTGVDVAAGISQALITTQFGLVIALPGVFGISRLRALIREIEARLGSLRAAALPHLEPRQMQEAA